MNKRKTPNSVLRALKGAHRRHKRYRTLSLRVDNPVVGRVVNVGQGGLALESPESLSVGATYHFKVRLGDRHLRLPGRIQWCRLTGTKSDGGSEARPVYQAGVALIDDVASKAWQVALRRMTEPPAHLIWHRARLKSSGESAHRPEVDRSSGTADARLSG